MELTEAVYAKIVSLAESGDRLYDRNLYRKAMGKYLEALKLVPSPLENWEATTWLATSIGDAYFEMSEFQNAKTYYELAMKSPGGIDNPYVNLSLGQVYFELQGKKKAREYLLRAFLLDGHNVFQGADLKYLALIRDDISNPTSEEMADKLMKVLDEVDEEFEKGNLEECLQLLERAWNSIPENKADVAESYLVADAGLEISLELNDISRADKWLAALEESSTTRQDVGDVDFAKGLVALEKNLEDEAKEHFKQANSKSEGRCFLGKNTEYKKYLN